MGQSSTPNFVPPKLVGSKHLTLAMFSEIPSRTDVVTLVFTSIVATTPS